MRGLPSFLFLFCSKFNKLIVCGRVPWPYQYWPGRFMALWFYVQELTGSCSGFKASQKTGQQLKVLSDRLRV